ncbi:F-box only protein 36 isoform X2 [Aplysia californica]|uniref:F-box only protein 36 isoform X2 n=1 Tax=Aplysia californica TaxID=6500 RepID=A0ABM0K5M5_APLCA|nr:F-box only protein 36 isoform X2 [Aplysia californica]
MASLWEQKCQPWLSEDGSIYSKTDTAPAPSKDFVQIYITPNEIYFRQWKIIPPTRADANQQPVEMKCTYEEFPDDDGLRESISRNLGEREVSYVDRLIAGQIDYPNRLPRKILLRIMFNLDLTSIAKLSQVNKQFRELGGCDALWSKIYMEHTTQPVTQELLMLTDQKGWKEVFFMNKLQLQRNLRRQDPKPPKEKSSFFMTS